MYKILQCEISILMPVHVINKSVTWKMANSHRRNTSSETAVYTDLKLCQWLEQRLFLQTYADYQT
jgi:hypothetical protein